MLKSEPLQGMWTVIWNKMRRESSIQGGSDTGERCCFSGNITRGEVATEKVTRRVEVLGKFSRWHHGSQAFEGKFGLLKGERRHSTCPWEDSMDKGTQS